MMFVIIGAVIGTLILMILFAILWKMIKNRDEIDEESSVLGICCCCFKKKNEED